MKLTLGSEEEQEAFGSRLALLLPPKIVIYLEGDLGAGKTTLVRGILRGLGWQGSVKSPTYTIMEPYDLADRRLYHFDLYRLADPEELEYLGLRDMVDSGMILFEWPERGDSMLPVADLHFRLTHLPAGRELELSAYTEAGRALLRELA